MTSIEVRLHAEVEEELQAVALWYETQRPGLGDRFLDAIAAGLRQLEHFAAAGSPLPRPVRGHRLRRHVLAEFPFALIYLEQPDRLAVLAVAHQRRRPGYWRSRTPR